LSIIGPRILVAIKKINPEIMKKPPPLFIELRPITKKWR
jgi:hypothetical protein